MTESRVAEDVRKARGFSRADFDRAYAEVVLGNHFFEDPAYYRREEPRYRRTLRSFLQLPLPPRPASVLEVGGGQIALLLARLFGDRCVLADVNAEHASAVERFGIEHVPCDLLHDDLPYRDSFDAVVLCEVIEHIPIPAHLVLEKVARWVRPGGFVFLTTPNLYRLRNVLRLAAGRDVFCHFFYPARGESIGHPFEYSAAHLRWQLEKAGWVVHSVELKQLANHGASFGAHVARAVAAPLLWARPLWRDNLVASAMRPSGGGARNPAEAG